MTDTTQAAGLTDEQKRVISETIGFGFELGELQAINESDLARLCAALAAQAVPAIDVEKHMCGYARLGSDGVYKLVGMRRNPIMDDGELHLILAFTDDQIESFAPPTPAEAKEEPKQNGLTKAETEAPASVFGLIGHKGLEPKYEPFAKIRTTPQPQAAQPVAMTDERVSIISRLKAQSVAHRHEAETDSADLIDEGVAALSAMTDLLEEARDTIAKLLIKIRRDAPDSAGRLLGYADQVVARVDAALDSPLPAQAAPKVPPCQGANCGATDGKSHSRECLQETAQSQGWEPEAKAQAVPEDGLRYAIRRHLANQHQYSHKEFCAKLSEILLADAPSPEATAQTATEGLQGLVDAWRSIASDSESIRRHLEASAMRTCAADLERHLCRSAQATPKMPKGWKGLSNDEKAAFVADIYEYGAGFVTPLWAAVEAIEKKLMDRNAAPHPATSEQRKPYLYVYEYDSHFGLHRDFYPREWNGMKPSRTVALYLGGGIRSTGGEHE